MTKRVIRLLHRTRQWLATRGAAALCISALSLAASTGFAANTGAKADPSADKAPAKAAPAATPRRGQLSAEEQRARAAEFLRTMRQTETRVANLARRARSDQDLIKLNCVNDKLVELKANLRLAEQVVGQLKLAAARRDEGARNHEFNKLTITYQKVTVLGHEAGACVGKEISYVGDTQVTVQVDPDIDTQGDPTEPPATPLPPDRPPLASPIL